MKTGEGVAEKDKLYNRASFSRQMLICFSLGETDLLQCICVYFERFLSRISVKRWGLISAPGFVQLSDFFT